MNREASSNSMTSTTKKIRAALLLGCALGAGELATAADQAAAAPSTERQEVKALQKQLEEVQAQLRELAEQNKALLEHQKVLDRELQEQQQQLAQQAAAQSQLNAQVHKSASPPASAAGAGALPATGGQVAQSTGGAAPTSVGQRAAPAAQGSGSSTSALPDNTGAAPSAGGAMASLASFAQNVKLWGYGEVYYTDPVHDRQRAQADLARAVFGIGYSFDSRTEFNSEYEVEHAVASSSDVGEFEVEQFYVDHQINDAVAVRGGLFLMPFGFLNEHHEPTNFYGVQRNFVETLIIPSTWREGGLNFHGDTQSGFGWNVGVTTGFDLSKWDFAPEYPPYTTALELEDTGSAPLQATHQELALANAHDLSQYVALSYFGVPGLTVGGAISTGKAVSVAAPPNAPIAGSQRVTLWEGHVRWTPDKFDLSALYARGTISNLAATNASNPGSPNPIPSSFYGYYLQAAYDIWQHNEYRLSPFARWEVYNLGASYAGTLGPDIPSGEIPLTGAPGDYGLWPRNEDRVWTVGANLYVTPHVVLKVDYQHFQINDNFTRFDLGLGLNF
ncbi:MAG TPA: porin [Steroidobacteraceae bacterium]|nr:porin [Steroidobacteraceae bacterium]